MSNETEISTVTPQAGERMTPRIRFPEFREARGWVRAPLSEVLTEHKLKSDGEAEVHSVSLSKGVISQVEHMGRSYSAADTSQYALVRPFDLVYTRSPLSEFKLGIVKQHRGPHNSIVSPLYGVFTPSNENLGRLIEAYFESPARSLRYLDPLAQKGAKNTIQISNTKFLSGDLFLPDDEREQKKIADLLHTMDDLIAAESVKLALLRKHRQGLLQQLFPREGEARPRLRFPEYRKTPDWHLARVGDLFDTASGGTPDRSKAEYWDGEIPWVTTSLIDFNILSSTKESITKTGLANSSAKVFPKHTVLMAMYGQGKTRGKVALLGLEAATNQACVAFLPNDAVEPGFTFVNLAGRYAEIREVSNDGGQKNLSQALVRELPFAYPEMRVEQQYIANCFSALDEQLAGQTRKLEALTQHKRGLLQQMFPAERGAMS